MKIFIAADHAGTVLKEALKKYLLAEGGDVLDFSPAEPKEGDDYPGYAFLVAEAVAKSPDGRGVLVCDTGVGVAIAANKVAGVRAALSHDESGVKRAREHNNANVLALGGHFLSEEKAKELVKIFLRTEFSGEERHVRRLGKITEYEKKHCS